MTIRKRWLLVILLVAGQTTCLLVGLAWFTNWLEQRLGAIVQDQVLDDNSHVAAHMAELVNQLQIKSLKVHSADWSRVQAVIEKAKLPNQGFLCIIDSVTGQLICHPEWRTNPIVPDLKPGLATLHTKNGDHRIVDLFDALPNESLGKTAGWAKLPDGVNLIAVRNLDRFGAKILVHQHQEGIDAAIGRIVQPVRQGGIVLTLLLVSTSAVVTMTITQRYENKLAYINAHLETLVVRRTAALMKTRNAIIFGLAKLAESRDNDTGRHLDRIRAYVLVLARQLARQNPALDEDFIERLGLASALHDIGKVGIPDSILLKPGKLSVEERVIMERHPSIGGMCLEAIREQLGNDDFLELACEIAFHHHERWDGFGYPFGLKGECIPLSARIVALADVYDALVSKRSYKAALSHFEAREIILAGDGTHFDPLIVNAFRACEDAIMEIGAMGGEDVDGPENSVARTSQRAAQVEAATTVK